MAKAKKRLSKKAKAALKVLEESKLLKDSGTSGTSNDGAVGPANTPTIKNSIAHKARPNKKRG